MTPAYQDQTVTIHCGHALDVLRELPDESVQCCVTSPPYWGLRDYGIDSQIGLEPTPQEYIAVMVDIFAQVRRVLKRDATLWLNLGDSYANTGGADRRMSLKSTIGRSHGGTGEVLHHAASASFAMPERSMGDLKPKDLVGIPWRVAFALQTDGWYLRSDIIWAKPNPMPESVTDRPTKSHEYVFLMSKSERYFFDQDAVKEPSQMRDDLLWRVKYGGYESCSKSKVHSKVKGDGKPDFIGQTNGARYWPTERNIRSVWTIATQPYPEAHFATFPEDLVKPCILAGSRPGDVVMDCFSGSGTALYVAKELGRRGIGIELNPDYIRLAAKRLRQEVLNFGA